MQRLYLVLAVLVAAVAMGVHARTAHSVAAKLAILEEKFGAIDRSPPARQIVVREVHHLESGDPEAAPVGDLDEDEQFDEPKADRPPMDINAIEQRHRIRLATKMSQLEHLHENEDLAPGWSEDAEETITALYSSADLSALRTSSSCKTTICRVDFSYVDPEGGPGAVQQLLAMHPWDGKFSVTFDWEQGEGTLYLAREGYPLQAATEAAQAGE